MRGFAYRQTPVNRAEKGAAVADVYEFLRYVQVVVFVGLAIAALRQWLTHRTRPSAWLAGTFGVLGAVVLVSRFLPAQSADPEVVFERKVLIAVLALFPYFLYRFATSFVKPVKWIFISAAVVTAFLVVWPFFMERIPERGEPRPASFQLFVVVLLVQWTALSLRSAYLLWRGAERQPATARRRMRTLSIGAVALAVTLLVAGAAPSQDEVTGVRIVTQLLAIFSAPLFLLGFAPPGLVRAAWRRPEEVALHHAEQELMQVTDVPGVANVVLPHAARLVGGYSATLRDNDDNVIARYEPPGATEGRKPVVSNAPVDDLVVKLERGTLAVRPSPFSPFFGREETEILETLAILTDLALARADLIEQLERSNRELEQFAYVASHDLQEPLRTIASYAELVAQRNREKLDDKAKRHIDYIVDGSTRMQALIDDLLRFSRIGTRAHVLEPVDAGEAVREATESLKVVIDEAGASVETGDLPMVNADRLQLTQLFQNLLTNAIKYRGDEPPRIRIEASVEDLFAEFSVRDNGLGIEPKHAERIFTIFQRLHTRQEYPGTGIGLAICKKIVERHGGRIWVESDGEAGSTFYFTLPVRSQS